MDNGVYQYLENCDDVSPPQPSGGEIEANFGYCFYSNIAPCGNVECIAKLDGYCGYYVYTALGTTNPGKNAGDVSSCPCHEGVKGGGSSTTGSAGGAGGSTVAVGDPINTSTGNAYLQQDDYPDGGWLTFRRFYNGNAALSVTEVGPHWRHSFDRSLQITGSPATSIVLFRPDGLQETFTKTSGVWSSDPDVSDVLTETDNSSGVATRYTVFIAALRHYETYSASGQLQTVTDETGQGITLTYSTSSTPSSVAPTPGLLLTVTDPEGRQLRFTYGSAENGFGQIATITLPDGGTLTYAYGSATSNLTSVTYPNGTTRQYIYNESSLTGGASLVGALTGIVDETDTRYESTTYNSYGQATSSYFAGNVDTTQVTYNGNGSASVTYPLGLTSTMTFVTVQGVNKIASLNQPCGPQCGQPWKSITYDTNGNPQTSVDFNGNTTVTTYNTSNLLATEVDAQGSSAQRTTNLTWNTTLRVPLTRTVTNAGGAIVSSDQWVYNTTGQTLAYCAIDPTNGADSGYSCSNTGAVPAGVRRTTYTYCTTTGGNCPLPGLLLSVTGPRTDLTQTTSYSYYTAASTTNCGTPGAACYQPGDLYQVTDALGHVTTIASYDADGRITRITDPNGVNTDLTYYPRGWLKTHTVSGAQTSFTYTAYGAVQTITDPDGVTTTFGYDTAHRLTQITDALGNYIQYTLDAAGDKTGESVYDSAGTLHKSLTRTFNTLGQLTSVVDGLNKTVLSASYSDSYDANGNRVHTADALGTEQHMSYDALNRLTQTIDDYNGTDSLTPNTTTGIGYDALDRTTQITDPSGLDTTYGFDGLSDATGLVSPDTGYTSRTFDAAGNVTGKTDAKGVVTQYGYDALNRLTSVTYPAQPSLNITYTYDQATPISGCPNNDNIGHLTTMTDASGTTSWCYTNQGDIREVRQVINNTVYLHGYAYTNARRLKYLQYPSGFELEYGYDADGRVNTIGYTQQPGPYGSYTDSTLTPLITSVSYMPFGPVSGYTYALDGQSVTRTYDANYRLTDLVGTGLTLHFQRDAKGRIEAEGNSPGANPASESYQYDPLDRLTTLTNASGITEQSIAYNPTGDRTSKTTPLGTENYTYVPGTHQLNGVGGLARSVDANGNTTAMTTASGELIGLGFDDRNRLTTITSGSNTIANYQYNGEGQRVWRTITEPSAGTAATVYDPAGSGNLYGEYFATNYREYVYLAGIPVASATDAGETAPNINYLYADHLGTLRAVVTTTGTTAYSWPWLDNAFGEQPSTGTSEFYIQFPGQYYDVETGLNYNGHRDYDSATGREIESDPKGMFGGQWSTYAYVGGDPLDKTDPLGLSPPGVPPPMGPFLPPQDLLPPGAEWVPPPPNILGGNAAGQAQCMAKYQSDLESNADIMGDALNDCANSAPAQDDPNGLITCRLEISAMWGAADYNARRRRDTCMKSCK